VYIALSLLNSGSLAALRDRCNTPCLQHCDRVCYACARAERALHERVLPDVDAALMGVAAQHVLPMHQTMLCVQPDTVGVHVNELLLYNDYLQNMLADFSAYCTAALFAALHAHMWLSRLTHVQARPMLSEHLTDHEDHLVELPTTQRGRLLLHGRCCSLLIGLSACVNVEAVHVVYSSAVWLPGLSTQSALQ